MGSGDIGRVKSDETRVLVVRAWRDCGRTVIRILESADHTDPAREWVFADVDSACRLIAGLLDEIECDTKR